MTHPTTHPELSEDVYAVLLDIAKEPDSVLLSSEPRRLSRELLTPSDPIRATASFLTSAERHLLTAHRDEVGRWLLAIAIEDLTHVAGSGTRFHWHKRGHTELERRPLRRDRLPSTAVDSRGRTWTLAHWVDQTTDSRREIERIRTLAVISMRLTRRPALQIFFGQLDVAQEHLKSARRRFFEALQYGGLYTKLANEWLGATAALCGDFAGAARAYAAAAHCSWATPESSFFWALNSAQLGKLDDVREGLAQLADFGPSDYDYLGYYRAVLNATSWKPTSACKKVAALDQLNGTVLHEVLEGHP